MTNKALVYALMIISFTALILSLVAARAADQKTGRPGGRRQPRRWPVKNHPTMAATAPSADADEG
jgi:hypothetical protein